MDHEAERHALERQLVTLYGMDAAALRRTALEDLRWLLRLCQEEARLRRDYGPMAAKCACGIAEPGK